MTKKFRYEGAVVLDSETDKIVGYAMGEDSAANIADKLNELYEKYEKLELENALLKDESNYYQVKSGNIEEEFLYIRNELEKTKEMFEVYKIEKKRQIIQNYDEMKQMIADLKQVLFVLACSSLPEDTYYSDSEIKAIERLTSYIGKKIIDIDKIKKNRR